MSDDLHGSHIPILSKLMERVEKPVLELGVGFGSTPILHWLCVSKGLPLLSLESDEKWMDMFQDYNKGLHLIQHFDFMDWQQHPLAKDSYELGLVLVDHRPARKRRSSVKFFKDRADYIVLHDSEQADNPVYKYTPIYKDFKYKYEYTKVGEPYTMVLSNKKELSWLKS